MMCLPKCLSKLDQLTFRRGVSSQIMLKINPPPWQLRYPDSLIHQPGGTHLDLVVSAMAEHLGKPSLMMIVSVMLWRVNAAHVDDDVKRCDCISCQRRMSSYSCELTLSRIAGPNEICAEFVSDLVAS